MLDAEDAIGTWQNPPEYWVFIGLNPRDGFPWQYGSGKCAVVFSQENRQWAASTNTARFPVLRVGVWADADSDTRDGEWFARHVAEAVISLFDDPAGESDKHWSDSVYAISSRWSGELTVFEVENKPGLWRAETSFEIETA